MWPRQAKPAFPTASPHKFIDIISDEVDAHDFIDDNIYWPVDDDFDDAAIIPTTFIDVVNDFY